MQRFSSAWRRALCQRTLEQELGSPGAPSFDFAESLYILRRFQREIFETIASITCVIGGFLLLRRMPVARWFLLIALAWMATHAIDGAFDPSGVDARDFSDRLFYASGLIGYIIISCFVLVRPDTFRAGL